MFSPDQFALLEQVADVMIPPSDTPGALDAGVPEFMRQMLAEWGSRETRRNPRRSRRHREAGLEHVSARPSSRCPPSGGWTCCAPFDAESLARQDPAYGKFKWLVLLGYYQSEAGATQELRYELVPGAWRACLPLAEVGRAAAI